MNYRDFLESKRVKFQPCGFEVKLSDLNPMMRDFQKTCVQLSLMRGKNALFEDCGMGKAFQLLEWSKQVILHTKGTVIVFAPLGVVGQLEIEASKFGYSDLIQVCKSGSDVVDSKINVTNYDRLHHFDPSRFTGIVIDESSILKNADGFTSTELIKFASGIHYRLACTATPSPNDLVELTQHAEFLGVMKEKAIKALFFKQAVGKNGNVHEWTIKPHSKQHFYQWLSSWAIAIRKPSDLGFSDEGYVLPELRIHEIKVTVSTENLSTLFPMEARGLSEQRQAKKDSLKDRVAATAQLVSEYDEPWIIWRELLAESSALKKAIPGAVTVEGSDKREFKAEASVKFIQGEYKHVITDPSILGFGANWQHCSKMAFVGLTNSYEEIYQAIRRCWRFGQTKPVDVYFVVSEVEGAIAANIKRKEQQMTQMFDELVAHMKEFTMSNLVMDEAKEETDVAKDKNWTLYLGDCIQTIKNLADESVGLGVTSVPFPNMYAYHNSPRDMGNCVSSEELLGHINFLVPELFRVMKSGRSFCIHLTQEPKFKGADGFVGMGDFRGDVIRLFQRHGFIYYGEVTIDKNPQLKATRNKESTLLFKTLANDSANCRMAMADYLLQFKKPGDNFEPIKAGISEKYNPKGGWITGDEWIEWAAPVWYRHANPSGNLAKLQPSYPSLAAAARIEGIRGEQLNGISEGNVLNVVAARTESDTKHLCPMQLCAIHRAIKLWSNPGDIVLDPWNGVGSTGWEALKLNRKYVGLELKREYWQQAILNLKAVESEAQVEQGDLFSLIDDDSEVAA